MLERDVLLIIACVSQFFNHFYCRQLSCPKVQGDDGEWVSRCPDNEEPIFVLQQDYAVDCAGSNYQLFSLIALGGLATVSFGVPIGFALRMWMSMRSEMAKVRKGEKKKIEAYRDFGLRFDYIAGDYKPTAYFAECVDLLRKLILSGIMIFVKPGTVIQAFTSMLISYVFVLIHLSVWPYVLKASNLLRLFTEIQLFLVLAVSLVLQIDALQLDEEGYGVDFYQTLLAVILGPLGIAVTLKTLLPDKHERAQKLLMSMSKVDYDGTSKKSKKRKKLHDAHTRRSTTELAIDTSGRAFKEVEMMHMDSDFDVEEEVERNRKVSHAKADIA